MSITARQIAKQLNLSEAAVSMALHQKPGVSTKTRARIIDTAKSLGYDFTKVTQTQPESGVISLIFYNKHKIFDSPFFAELTAGIESVFKNTGYRLMINNIYDIDDVTSQLDDIVSAGCDGIILLGTEMEKEDFFPFSFIDLPIILLDSYFNSIKMDCILINNVDGARLATNYLIKKRHSQPGYLRSSCPINNFEERADGYYKSIRENGLPVSKCITHLLSPSIVGAYEDMLVTIDRNDELATCYFADNDDIAIGAMRAFRDRGFKIPEDIAIIGFDNTPFSSYVDPPLTTVNVPKTYMGKVAAERMLSIIHNTEFHPIKIELSTALIIRQSVCC